MCAKSIINLFAKANKRFGGGVARFVLQNGRLEKNKDLYILNRARETHDSLYAKSIEILTVLAVIQAVLFRNIFVQYYIDSLAFAVTIVLNGNRVTCLAITNNLTNL